MEKLREEVISNIRACLISTKENMSLNQLQNDYRTIIGDKIPFRQLGYKNLDEFVMSIPTIYVTKNFNGDLCVRAEKSDKSNHISNMVSRQKTSKKKSFRNVSFKVQQAPSCPKRWRPANTNFSSKNFKNSPRTATVSHKQLVSRKPTISSQILIPQHSTFHKSAEINVKNQIQRNETVVKPKNFPNIPVGLEKSDDTLLQSTKQRITKKMAQISLERDSGNSSPTNENDPVSELKHIAECYKLGPVEISNTTRKPKNRNAPTIYNCIITVDEQSYLSYPKDFFDEKSAQEHCAREALKNLLPKYEKRKSLLLSTSKDIKERIPSMLMAHSQDIWSWQIEADYTEKYMEQLPINWLEIIDSCDCVVVEKPFGDKYILRYCQPGTKGIVQTSKLPVDISIPANTIRFDDGDRLYAQITCIMSLNEIWARQFNTPDFEAYCEMIANMESYYEKNCGKHETNTLKEGSFYVIKFESNWYRARILEIKDDSVDCFLIDYGDEFTIEKNSIFDIKREFATCQQQAFVCRLAGLEDLYEANVTADITKYLGDEVILEAAQSGDTDETGNDQIIPVIMYNYSTGESINEELLQIYMIEMSTPTITPLTVQEVYVSHLSKNGKVYVQMRTKNFENLQNRLHVLETELQNMSLTEFVEKIEKSKWSNNKDRLYLYRYQKDGHLYRTKVKDMSPDGNLAQIYFIDTGNFEITKVNEATLYRLDKISDVINRFPPQCVEITMALDVDIPSNFIEIVSKLMNVDSPVLLKVIRFNENNEPIGEFYKRSSDGGLFCINKSIMLEIEMKSKNDDNVSKGTRKTLTKLIQLKDKDLNKENVPSAGVLQCPKLPDRGKYFEVKIPVVVNPWNFFVQPLSSQNELDEMMRKIQECYRNSENKFKPLQIGTIVPGQIYASKHTDGQWYRICVLKVTQSGSISVFYCDFGYYSSLNINQLFHLDPKFTTLPYQAMKAKLSGIKPKKNKWSMEDCELFTSMVKGKSFVSVLIDVENDELYESDLVLKLKLIDVSTDDDVIVEEELVRRNIAVKA